MIDAYTKFLWYGIIKSKKKAEVFKALQKIIKKTGQFSRVISDGELSYCGPWFHKKSIYYHSLSLSKHPSFVENAQRTLKQRLYSYLRLNHTKNWPRVIKGNENPKFHYFAIHLIIMFSFTEVIDSINESSHKGIWGQTPTYAEKEENQLALELLRRKFQPTEGFLSKKEQENLEKEFFSKKKNQLLAPGRYCLADVEFSKNISKGHSPKRSQIFAIHSIDFSQEPILFTLESITDHKVVPIKVRKIDHFCKLLSQIQSHFLFQYYRE